MTLPSHGYRLAENKCFLVGCLLQLLVPHYSILLWVVVFYHSSLYRHAAQQTSRSNIQNTRMQSKHVTHISGSTLPPEHWHLSLNSNTLGPILHLVQSGVKSSAAKPQCKDTQQSGTTAVASFRPTQLTFSHPALMLCNLHSSMLKWLRHWPKKMWSNIKGAVFSSYLKDYLKAYIGGFATWVHSSHKKQQRFSPRLNMYLVHLLICSQRKLMALIGSMLRPKHTYD